MTIAESEPASQVELAIQERIAAQQEIWRVSAEMAMISTAYHDAIVRLAGSEAVLHELGYADRSFLQVPAIPDHLMGNQAPQRPLYAVE